MNGAWWRYMASVEPPLVPDPNAVRASAASGSLDGIVGPDGRELAGESGAASTAAECGRVHVPTSVSQGGEWRWMYVEPDPAPF